MKYWQKYVGCVRYCISLWTVVKKMTVQIRCYFCQVSLLEYFARDFALWLWPPLSVFGAGVSAVCQSQTVRRCWHRLANLSTACQLSARMVNTIKTSKKKNVHTVRLIPWYFYLFQLLLIVVEVVAVAVLLLLSGNTILNKYSNGFENKFLKNIKNTNTNQSGV